MTVVFVSGAVGVWIGVIVPIIYQWFMRGYRGEWHCPTCHHVACLPKDDHDYC